MEKDYDLNGYCVMKFSAEWCAPCKRLDTIITKMESEFPDIRIYKVDIDEDFETAKKYNIKSVPTLLFFRSGKETNKIEQLEKTETIRKAFKSLCDFK